VFEKSRFCHISPTSFPIPASKQLGRTVVRAVGLDLPGLFKHPLRKVNIWLQETKIRIWKSAEESAILAHKKASTVWSIGPNAMVIDAIQLMGEKNVGALPVVDNGTLVGIVSERDYTRKVILKGRSSKETPVSDIMTAQLLTVTPSDNVIECMRIMTEKRVRHLPVLEGTNLVGILSIGDVVNWFITAQTATIDDLERYIGWR
jgi:CBS domain-containing protein